MGQFQRDIEIFISTWCRVVDKLCDITAKWMFNLTLNNSCLFVCLFFPPKGLTLALHLFCCFPQLSRASIPNRMKRSQSLISNCLITLSECRYYTKKKTSATWWSNQWWQETVETWYLVKTLEGKANGIRAWDEGEEERMEEAKRWKRENLRENRRNTCWSPEQG